MADGSSSFKKLAVALNADDDCNVPSGVVILIPALGPLYDIVIAPDDKMIIGKACIADEGCCVDITRQFERVVRRSSAKEHNTSSSSSGNRTLDRQAAMFISLILEVWHSKQKQLHGYMVTPALHGLYNCMESGWWPESIPSELIDMLVTLLDSSCSGGEADDSGGSGDRDSAPELAQLSQRILLAAMRRAPIFLPAVATAVVSSLRMTPSFTSEQLTVLLEACPFLAAEGGRAAGTCHFPYMRDSIIAVSGDDESSDSHHISSPPSSSTTQKIDRLARAQRWAELLSLSDRVEVKHESGMWLPAQVVQVDALRKRLMLEILSDPTTIANGNFGGTDFGAHEGAVTVVVEGYLQSSLIRDPRAVSVRGVAAGGSADDYSNITNPPLASATASSTHEHIRDGSILCELILGATLGVDAGSSSSSADEDMECLCECGFPMMLFNKHFSDEELSSGKCHLCSAPWVNSSGPQLAQRWLCSGNDCNRELCFGCLKSTNSRDYVHIYLESNNIHHSCPVHCAPSADSVVTDAIRLGEVIEVHSSAVDGYYRLLDGKGFVPVDRANCVWGLAHQHASLSVDNTSGVLSSSLDGEYSMRMRRRGDALLLSPSPFQMAFRIHLEHHDVGGVSGLYCLAHVADSAGEFVYGRHDANCIPVYTMSRSDITYALFCENDNRAKWYIGVSRNITSLGSIAKLFASSHEPLSAVYSNAAAAATTTESTAQHFLRALTACRWQNIAPTTVAVPTSRWSDGLYNNRWYLDELVNIRVFAIELLLPNSSIYGAIASADGASASCWVADSASRSLSEVVEGCFKLDSYRSHQLAQHRLPSALYDDHYAGILEDLFRSFGNLLSHNIASTFRSGLAVEADNHEGGALHLVMAGEAASATAAATAAAAMDTKCVASNISYGVRSRFSRSIFEFLFREIVLLLCERVDCCATPSSEWLESSPAAAQALRGVRLLLNSAATSSLNPLLRDYFFENIIVRSALRAQMVAQSALSQLSSVDLNQQCSLVEATVGRIKALEAAYACLLRSGSHCSDIDERVINSRIGPLLAKLQAAVGLLGFAAFANGVIEKIGRGDNRLLSGCGRSRSRGDSEGEKTSPSSSSDSSFKGALQTFALCGASDRFSEGARQVRRIVGLLAMHASPRGLVALERVWRAVIADFATDAFYNERLPSSAITSNSEALCDSSDALVHRLMSGLRVARDASSLDMASCAPCRSSADKAFAEAFARLRKDRAVEVAKSLAIFISNLLDALKQEQQEYNSGWSESLGDAADLASVLFSQSADQAQDFHFFYELLLARRLLRSRFLSLSVEMRTLQLLPDMPKSLLMIADVARTEDTMFAFQRFLLGRLDRGELCSNLCASVRSLVFDGRLRLHTLSGSLWPALWVSPLQFSGLRLPQPMAQVAREFETFFSYQDLRGNVDKGAGVFNNNMRSFPSIKVSGCAELYSINGVYEATADNWNGWPIYSLRQCRAGSQNILEFNVESKSWEIKSVVNRGSNKSIARAAAAAVDHKGSSSGRDLSHPSLHQAQWSVFVDGHWRAAAGMSAVQASATRTHPIVDTSSLVELEAAAIRPRRRLYWCRGAGTVVLRACLENGFEASLLASEAQAVLLVALAGILSSASGRFTLRGLAETTGLSLAELYDVLRSLSADRQPILSDLTSASPDQELSVRSVFSEGFLTGRLSCFSGRASDDEPTVLSTFVSKEGAHVSQPWGHGSISSIHGWRNDLIDASIVRTLKEALKSSSGEFASSRGRPCSALTADLLLQVVKASLSERCNVCFEDIVRRSERLAGIGIIDKVRGDVDTFRSYAYCYLSDSEAEPSIPTPAATRVTQRMHGEDLFSQLRGVLGVARMMPPSARGVSLELFRSRMIAWVCSSPLSIESSSGGSRLCVADAVDAMAVHARTLCQQLSSLLAQHRTGRGVPEEGGSFLGDHRLLDNLSLLITRARKTSSIHTIGLLGVGKTLYDALPIPDKCCIVNAYRALCGIGGVASATHALEGLTREQQDAAWRSEASLPRQSLLARLPPILLAGILSAEHDQPVGPESSVPSYGEEGKFSDRSCGIEEPAPSTVELKFSFSAFFCAVASVSPLDLSAGAARPDPAVTFGELLSVVVVNSMGATVRRLFFSEHESKEAAAMPTTSEPIDRGAGLGDDRAEQFGEVLLPCEFCPDLFPLSQLSGHQRLCREARARGVVLDAPPSRQPLGGSKVKLKSASLAAAMNDSNYSLRMQSDSSLRLAESLLDDVISSATPAGDVRVTLGNVFLECFRSLDSDSDGYLSRADFVKGDDVNSFSSPLSGASGRAQLSPMLLYSRPSPEAALAVPASPVPAKEVGSSDDLSPVPSSPSLARLDSLWASLLQEKFLPSPSKSRSLVGIGEAEAELQALIDRVREVIHESESETIALLLHVRWDFRSLIEEFLEDANSLRRGAGLGPSDRPSFLRYDFFGAASGRSGSLLGTAAVTVTCGICIDDAEAAEAFALNCGHYYCKGCWEGYLCSAVRDHQVRIRCPSPQCGLLVPCDMIELLCDREVYCEARATLVKEFVEERRGRHIVSYCKNPRGCDGVLFLADDASFTEAVCSLCASAFCANCDFPPHAPASCDLVASWEEAAGYLETGKDGDMEARKLKHLTTRPCPKCGARIEKNGGCPHMSCRCKYQFCWDCGGEYHTSVACTRQKVVPDSGSILHFDAMDKQVANHFLARQVALKGRAEGQQLFDSGGLSVSARSALGVRIGGWECLAQAQSALAHSCIIQYSMKSAKLNFLFDCLKNATQSLQQRFEEAWVGDEFPEQQARVAVRALRAHLREYLLLVSTETSSGGLRQSSPKAAQQRVQAQRAADPVHGDPIFGDAFVAVFPMVARAGAVQAI